VKISKLRKSLCAVRCPWFKAEQLKASGLHLTPPLSTVLHFTTTIFFTSLKLPADMRYKYNPLGKLLASKFTVYLVHLPGAFSSSIMVATRFSASIARGWFMVTLLAYHVPDV
jgi:hypothetical protein